MEETKKQKNKLTSRTTKKEMVLMIKQLQKNLKHSQELNKVYEEFFKKMGEEMEELVRKEWKNLAVMIGLMLGYIAFVIFLLWI